MKPFSVLFAFGKIFVDLCAVYGGLIFAYFLRMRWFEVFDIAPPAALFPFDPFALSATYISLLIIFIFAINGRYTFGNGEKKWDEIRQIFWNFSAGMALILVVFFFAKFTFFSRFIFGVAWISSMVFLITMRMLLRWLKHFLQTKGIGRTSIILIGSGTMAKHVLQYLEETQEYDIIGVCTEGKSDGKTWQGHKILGSISQIRSIIKNTHAEEILVASEESSKILNKKFIQNAHIKGINLRFIPDELNLDLANVEISTAGNFPALTLRHTPLLGWGRIMKRMIDVVFSIFLLILTSPVLLVTFLLIKAEDWSAPAIYKSIRVGKNGKEFTCYKLRTMVVDADKKKKELLKKNERKGGILFKMKDDPRVTKLGNILRRTSIDELPQLWNVLVGSMSIIGPRPHLPEEVKGYEQEHLSVLAIKPGISGFSQINGRSALSLEEEMSYELFYLKNWNLLLDAIIFVKSIWIVIRQKDAH